MTGVSRFDCYPSDFLNGLVGLKAPQIAVYTVVILSLYDRGEPINLDTWGSIMAARAGLSPAKFSAALDVLIGRGKVYRTPEGLISQKRFEDELTKIRERMDRNRENSARGGEANKRNFRANSRAEWSRSAIRSDSSPPPPSANRLNGADAQIFFAEIETSQFLAWVKHLADAGKPCPIPLESKFSKGGRKGIWVPSEWPPKETAA